ncbi:SET and MYND domain-containing protein 4-like isoform X1 [Euwallacea fornicatus]|uniref:SET and MYND domain-containing protein 4-like isoform X1 n=1 Tax=Euwallacea fornicatus TaxID=995702 RepID=UPI00338F03F5
MEGVSPTLREIFSNSIEVLGLTRFYTDEFDAFQKYYTKINLCSDSKVIMRIVNQVDHLQFDESCDLSERVRRIPKKDEQNLVVPSMEKTNESIEFAHPSLKIVETEEKGRHLISTGNLDKGAILINEKATILQVNPLCMCMEGEHKIYRCHHCAYAIHKFYTCTGCNIVIYCSLSCLLQSHNDYHRFECEGLQRHFWTLEDTDFSYIAFRMVLYGARYNFVHNISDNHDKWGIDGNNYPFVYKLKSNFDRMPVRKIYEILWQAVKTVTYLIMRTNFFSSFQMENENILHIYVGGLFVKHYCQAQMNAVLLRYPNLDAEFCFNALGGNGKAICPTIALINHSCSPNAVIIPYNGRILVKAIKPIGLNEEITISYQEISIFFSLEERQLLMTDYFYFNALCGCSLCNYESNWRDYPYKCHNCQTGVAKKVTFSNEGEKLFCKDCQSYSSIDKRAEKTAEIAGNVYRKTFTVEPVIRIAESYDRLFPKDSWMLLDAYRVLYDKFSIWGEKPLETMKYGLMFFKVLEEYVSRLHLPFLEAQMKFFHEVINSKKFLKLERVTDDEFSTIKCFSDQCIRIKNDILFYIPVPYLEYYYMGLLGKLENVQRKLKVINN